MAGLSASGLQRRGALMADQEDLLEPSSHEADGGLLVGKHPRDVPSEILARYYPAQNPLKAIRARCLDCCCGNASEVRKCVALDCPSWPFRMGANPFRAKRQLSAEQKRAMTERLARAREAGQLDLEDAIKAAIEAAS